MKYLLIAVIVFIGCLVAFPCFYVTKMLITDVYIMIKGERYMDTCTSKSGIKNCCHRVEWKDSKGIKNAALFNITSFRKPPFRIKVYSVGNDPDKTNLGLRSVLYYIPVVFLFDTVLLALFFGALPEYIRFL